MISEYFGENYSELDFLLEFSSISQLNWDELLKSMHKLISQDELPVFKSALFKLIFYIFIIEHINFFESAKIFSSQEFIDFFAAKEITQLLQYDFNYTTTEQLITIPSYKLVNKLVTKKQLTLGLFPNLIKFLEVILNNKREQELRNLLFCLANLALKANFKQQTYLKVSIEKLAHANLTTTNMLASSRGHTSSSEPNNMAIETQMLKIFWYFIKFLVAPNKNIRARFPKSQPVDILQQELTSADISKSLFNPQHMPCASKNSITKMAHPFESSPQITSIVGNSSKD
jgi:hypothetical protein